MNSRTACSRPGKVESSASLSSNSNCSGVRFDMSLRNDLSNIRNLKLALERTQVTSQNLLVDTRVSTFHDGAARNYLPWLWLADARPHVNNDVARLLQPARS